MPMPLPLFFTVPEENQFSLSIFSGAYRFKHLHNLALDSATKNDIFVIERSERTLDDIPESVLENIPTFGEIMEILDRSYLTEFLISMAINEYPIADRIEKNLIVNAIDNTAYIQIKCTSTNHPNNPIYKDYFSIYSPVTFRGIEIGDGSKVEWTHRVCHSISRPIYCGEIDLSFDFPTIKKRQEDQMRGLYTGKLPSGGPQARFTSKAIDMARLYFAFIDPVIQDMTSHAIHGDPGKTSIQMADYLRFSIDMNTAYSSDVMSVHITAVPNRVLKHNVYWTSSSSFTVENHPFDDFDNIIEDQSEIMPIVGTACAPLIPMVMPGPFTIRQNGEIGYHFKYDTVIRDSNLSFTNQLLLPFGSDSKSDTNPVYFLDEVETLESYGTTMVDRVLTKRTYKVRVDLNDFANFDSQVVFSNPDPIYGVAIGLLTANFDEYLDPASFRHDYSFRYGDRFNPDGPTLFPREASSHLIHDVGIPIPEAFQLKLIRAFPMSRVYLILASVNIDALKRAQAPKSQHFQEQPAREDIIGMESGAKAKRSGLMKFLRGDGQ